MKDKFYTLLKEVGSFLKPFAVLLCKLITVGFAVLIYFLIGYFFGTNTCYARTVYYGSEVETVTISYGGPTIFRFNEDVKTISQAAKFSIKPADGQDPNYSVLAVTPRFTQGKAEVSFILADGAVVNTKIVIVPKALPEKTDSFYDFQPKERLIDSSVNSEGSDVSDLELMKSMIRWDNVVGYKVRNLIRTVNTGVDGLSAKLVRVYTGPKYNGYVFKIRNESRKEYAIDVKSLTLGVPNVALLSQVDRKILESRKSKENTTFLRIIAKPTSVYYNIALPIAPIQNQ
ncbi:MAG: hypothetical protein CME70_15515 [Halobacteriovorax sp.]|nr:hypothetical protein [Halobacteriovorax sp.]|tara:strand:+ start:24592 stop:25452 length:861 start_codon:yes stop_codon:yes gene_type:complete